jgi:SpoVK/Ycf46/Vps4 family AAA+-type ATPase
MKQVTAFEKFKSYQKKHHLDEVMPSATGLVILFHGPSGTGKTLTANAIAAQLKKRVLLVNINFALGNLGDSQKNEGTFQALFREAEMNEAVVFFDECESLFAQRTSGGSSVMTELLTEVERYNGIIFLATNRPFDLDEAMHRRINSVFEFRQPSHLERERIWQLHTKYPGIVVDETINWGKIAEKYELSGGFIKNAVTSALLIAISRDGQDTPVIKEEDIVEGCSMQMRGSLQMKMFSQRVVPKAGLSELVLSEKLRQSLEDIVRLEKARSVLYGDWGFGTKPRAEQSTSVIFWGPPGCGKTAAAEALGFEVGQPLKVVNVAELAKSDVTARVGAESQHGSGGALEKIFHDAALMNAVLVLDNLVIPVDGDVQPRFLGLLEDMVYHMDHFGGVVILVVTSRIHLSVSIHRLDPDFVRKFKFIVEFNTPTSVERARLWRSLIPEKTPKAPKINFETIGQRFDFTPGQISRVVYRAAAAAVLRPLDARVLTEEDLIEASEQEKRKTHGDLGDIASGWIS